MMKSVVGKLIEVFNIKKLNNNFLSNLSELSDAFFFLEH